MSLALNVPVNSVSFGQVSTALLRETKKRSIESLIFPIGGSVDLSSQPDDEEFASWVTAAIKDAYEKHDRNDPIFKLWHLSEGLESYSKDQTLMSFHETDSPTELELNTVRNNRTIFTSRHSVEVFASMGASSNYVPLAFDSASFSVKSKKYFTDDRIVFNLCGKFENRKHHPRILKAWAKKYGSNNKYFLQCSLFNHFLSAEDNNSLIAQSLDGKKYSNIQVLNAMPKNTMYNDYLNSANIVIGMSGGEGWGLPEFHSIALGKHGVILNAHGYSCWANEGNAVLVEPSGKQSAVDNMFFKPNGTINQGEIFSWDEDDFLDACDEAVKRAESNPVNDNGLKLQEEYTYSKTLDEILKVME